MAIHDQKEPPPGTAHRRHRRTPRGTISGLLRDIALHEPHLYKQAINRILTGTDLRSTTTLLQLAASYLDGKPIERVQVEQTGRLFILGARVDVGRPETFAPAITGEIVKSEGLERGPLSLSPENTKDSAEVT